MAIIPFPNYAKTNLYGYLQQIQAATQLNPKFFGETRDTYHSSFLYLPKQDKGNRGLGGL